jgi:hypothetical protein
MVGAFVFPVVSVGMMEVSTTRNPSTPRTRIGYVVDIWEGRAKYLHLLKKVSTTVDNSVDRTSNV